MITSLNQRMFRPGLSGTPYTGYSIIGQSQPRTLPENTPLLDKVERKAISIEHTIVKDTKKVAAVVIKDVTTAAVYMGNKWNEFKEKFDSNIHVKKFKGWVHTLYAEVKQKGFAITQELHSHFVSMIEKFVHAAAPHLANAIKDFTQFKQTIEAGVVRMEERVAAVDDLVASSDDDDN